MLKINNLKKPIFHEEVFDNFFSPGSSGVKKNLLKCDIYENDEKTFVEMDCITNRRDNVSIQYENQHLIIEIKKDVDPGLENITYILKERTNNVYYREIFVGNIDFDKTGASLKNGTLIIQIPKDKKTNLTKNPIQFDE